MDCGAVQKIEDNPDSIGEWNYIIKKDHLIDAFGFLKRQFTTCFCPICFEKRLKEEQEIEDLR
jgi:hypothetical protein